MAARIAKLPVQDRRENRAEVGVRSRDPDPSDIVHHNIKRNTEEKRTLTARTVLELDSALVRIHQLMLG